MSEQLAGWSEWIEHKPGDPCPIPDGAEFEFRCREGDTTPGEYATCWDSLPHYLYENEIVAYRIALPLPAGFVPPGAEKPWVPPQQPGYGPWVECDSNTPIPRGVRCAVLLANERSERRYSHVPWGFDEVCQHGDTENVTFLEHQVAYAVCLADQPTQEQVEATQKPDTMEQRHRDALDDFDPANRPMFDADDVGVLTGNWARHEARQAWKPASPAPGFMVRPIRNSDGLLTVREADHRLGGWQ